MLIPTTVLFVLMAAGPAFAQPAADALFEVSEIPSVGRSVAAELVEIDGDGRVDLLIMSLEGIPPAEKRSFRVHLQRPDGSLPSTPDRIVAVPPWTATYDVADLRPESPGEELVLLRPGVVTILSLAQPEPVSWQLAVPGPTTVGLAADERGLEPYGLVSHAFGDEPWILVPQLGQLTALSAEGELRARLDLQRRANYFITPPTGLLALESDLQVFVDAPKIATGDVDGDGQADFVSSNRHEVRVFLRRPDGSFGFAPDRVHALGLVTARDHIRGSGGVATDARDIDGDGRLDLLVSHTEGSVTDARSSVYLYMNRGGGWSFGTPDQTLLSRAALASNALLDQDGDGRSELFQVGVPFSVLEVVETLLSREVDVEVSVRRLREDGTRFEDEPFRKRKLEIAFSFETFRPLGFVPSASADLNADGRRDLVTSGDGKAIEVKLGTPDGFLEDDAHEQPMPTAGVIHFRDFDGDGLEDFVLFDPHNFEVEVRVGRNLGRLPGTRPEISPAP